MNVCRKVVEGYFQKWTVFRLFFFPRFVPFADLMVKELTKCPGDEFVAVSRFGVGNEFATRTTFDEADVFLFRCVGLFYAVNCGCCCVF